MSDEDSFGDFFDSFTEGMKPGGARVSELFGRLRYRQGANGRNWQLPGSQNFLAGHWHMQCGCSKWTGAAATSGGWEITFPIQFAEPPIVLMTVTNTTPLFEFAVVQATLQSKAVIEAYWWSNNNLTRLDVFWLALGPISLK